MTFGRLLRFHPTSNSSEILIGEPVDSKQDVGLATHDGQEVKVKVYSGKSVLDHGSPTDREEIVGRLLSPLTEAEVGTIRCIGLNYRKHAEEAKMSIPTEPTVFMKPSTSLADPYPSPTPIPKHTVSSNCADYESELVIVIGKAAKNVSEAEANDYILGYTAGNDVSSRNLQFSQTQWCYSKGFDKAAPIGPVVASKELIGDPKGLKMRGLHNGKVQQESGIDDMVFNAQQIVSFLSQGTTLKPGTIIMTGTPAGVGVGQNPKNWLHGGDEFAVEILPHIGTLITKFEEES